MYICMHVCLTYLPLLSPSTIRLACSEGENVPISPLPPHALTLSVSPVIISAAASNRQGTDKSSGLRGRDEVGTHPLFAFQLFYHGSSIQRVGQGEELIHILLPQLSLGDPAPGSHAVCILST